MVVCALAAAGVLAARLCHSGILWPEEGLPLAAAVQVLHGKALYREVWFDKPPLVALSGLLWGARAGWILRLAGAAYVLSACGILYHFARAKWGAREGVAAACLLAFFLTFWIPSAVMPLAADLLMLAPHALAAYLAWRGRAFWCGVVGGVALLVNAKAVFVVAACLLWQWRAWPMLVLGLLIPHAAFAGWLAWRGALAAFSTQVWSLGFSYAGNTFVEEPLRNGLARTLNWAGFHAALVAGAAWFWWRERDADARRLAAWGALSLAAVVVGWRFFPRYYFQLLPVFCLAAARGWVLLGRKRWLLLILLAIPLARFGPRYALLARDLGEGRQHAWRDVAMDADSRAAARLLRALARPGDTLFVWGYRPDIFVYTRLAAGSRFLESQPLTGVLADRHLFEETRLDANWAAAHRAELARSRPTFVVDGLSAYNPRLAIPAFEDLRPWLAGYREVGRTSFSVIYRRL